MRIAVITSQDSNNYGAFLQAYCLKNVLEAMGHTVFHTYTRSTEYVRGLFYKEKPKSGREKLFFSEFSKKQQYGKKQYAIFQDALKAFNVCELTEIRPELYILGSDEIWNINKAEFKNDCFWGIGLGPAISYAASIGDANIADFARQPEQINAVRKLSAALVQDERTKSFVEQYAPTTAKLVCDPTMLIPADSYGEDFQDDFIKNNDCLLVYAYSLSNDEINAISKYAKSKRLKTVACCFYHTWCDYQCLCSPLQFSSLIRQCKAVVTTTFHGTIFSVLNHANFVSISVSPKTRQLMNQLGIPERMVERGRVSFSSVDEVLSRSISYQNVDAQIETMRTDSLQALAGAINDAEKGKEFDYQICRSNDCTACLACVNKCPSHAISCVTDKYDRVLPLIDPSLCISCGMCKKVCPQNEPLKRNQPLACYAAQRRSAETRRLSASGGIGGAIMEYFVHNGDIVYGAAILPGSEVGHIRATDDEAVSRLRRSKYVQSFIGTSYSDALTDLKAGRKVLFTGTPCQIAGLRRFLGKDYDNLFCIDIICHGVPPVEYLKQHIKNKLGTNDVNDIVFRGGESKKILSIYNKENEIVYKRDNRQEEYYYAFLNGLFCRENCYHCQYANESRIGDLTIGDFWGIKRDTLVSGQTGNISVVLPTTEKGVELLNLVRDELVTEERALQEAVDGNPQLRRPQLKHKCRAAFLSAYEKSGKLCDAIGKCGIERERKLLCIKASPALKLLRTAKKFFWKR